MSTFPLDQIDEYLLKQIVKKFTPFSGTAFYCSCRGAKNFVDGVKPKWSFPGSKLIYYARTRYIRGAGIVKNFPNLPLEFCRIEKMDVSICETDCIKTVVLPEVAVVGRVGRMNISGISDSDVQLLIAAAKPETVALLDDYYDPTSPIFEHAESYWRTTKLFELAKNRRSITLHLWHSSREIIGRFIENWLKGEQTGTLERLTVIPNLYIRTEDEVRWLRKEMEDLMKSHIKTEEGYIVERRGLDRLRIAVDFTTLQVHFYFS